MEKRKVVKRELRFAVHVPARENSDDYHYIKESLTYSDGKQEPSVRLIKDYQRPVFVTKESARNHYNKKETESLSNLVVKKCTDSALLNTVASMLGKDYKGRGSWKSSPYVYGTNLTAASFIKMASLRRNDFHQTPYSIAAFDLETTTDHKKVLNGSVVKEVDGKWVIHSVVLKSWVDGIKDLKEQVLAGCDKHIPEFKGQFELELVVIDDEIDLLKNLYRVCNEWAPDFLSIWNIDFDINNITVGLCKSRGVNIRDVICDQSLPKSLRRFTYREGRNRHVRDDGTTMLIPPADRWHKVICTSTFQVIDAMCSYRRLRLHGQRESYALDAVLEKNIKMNKLKFPEADVYKKASWHDFMQKNMRVEYIVYNIFDNIGQLLLDKKTKDLSTQVPLNAEIADFNDFGSSEAQHYAAFFYYNLEKGEVLGVGSDMTQVYKEYSKNEKIDYRDAYTYKTLPTTNWIQTVPQNNVVRNGLKMFSDVPFLFTNARGGVCDHDSVASYPNCIIFGNVSGPTCVNEVIHIKGLNPMTFRSLNLGIVFGNTNALEYGEIMFGFDNMETVMKKVKTGSL